MKAYEEEEILESLDLGTIEPTIEYIREIKRISLAHSSRKYCTLHSILADYFSTSGSYATVE